MSATFLPNKPMMLAAGVMRWIARPAHCGSISASRSTPSDGRIRSHIVER